MFDGYPVPVVLGVADEGEQTICPLRSTLTSILGIENQEVMKMPSKACYVAALTRYGATAFYSVPTILSSSESVASIILLAVFWLMRPSWTACSIALRLASISFNFAV